MKTIRVDESFNLKTIQISTDDTIELQLDETPTTGYKWELQDTDKEDIQLLQEEYTLYEGAGIGAGGMKTIRFNILTNGKGKIVFENRQRWSKDVYRTFTLFYETV